MKTKHCQPEMPGAYRKDLNSALQYFLKENVPALAGDLICRPVVDEIVKLVDHYLPATEHLRPGQVLWYAVAAEETAGYGKKIEACRIAPVLVELINDEDIEDYMSKMPKRQRQKKVAVRLHQQTYAQGGVFSYADSAALMKLSPHTVGKYIREYEEETGQLVPRRGNIHDLGPTLTHKRIICIKHFSEGKSIEQTARETRHSPAAVSRYTNDFKRVHSCLKEGWDLPKITQATALSKSLVKEYVDLMQNNDMMDMDDENLPF